jgi:formylglycine-generating enzyme required for sulfatase activity
VLALSGFVACGKLAGFEDLSAACPANTPRCNAFLTGGQANAGGSGGETPATSGGDAGTGGTTEDTGGASSTGAAGATGATGGGTSDVDASDCAGSPGTHGPVMSKIRRDDGSTFWIDQTEVTVAQYGEFEKAHYVFHNTYCEANPDPSGSFPCEVDAPDAGPTDWPRACVDWCDAAAFCEWAGKALCRDVPKDGPRDVLAPVSDYVAACWQTDAKYGCGEGCSASECNGQSAGDGAVLRVGAKSLCCVRDACDQCNVYDLSGNVGEWTAACDPETADGRCTIRGGGFDSNDDGLECSARASIQRRAKLSTVGFRCCHD